MTYLLDTNVWLWMLMAPARLGKSTESLVTSASNRLLLSAVSSTEIAIKWRNGRLELPEPPETYVPKLMAEQGVVGLALEHAHALQTAHLDHHHRDPFDRLLIAQAQVEDVPIITSDRIFESYPVEVIRAD